MMEAVIFIGVQGSGKTTFYRERFFDTHLRISLDLLRTRRREHLIFSACLEAHQSFVVDNTNPLAVDRARYIGPARAAGFRVIGYFFHSSLRDAIRRNSQRKAKQEIPIAGVISTFRKLQVPTLEEGFDDLYTVEIPEDKQFVLSSGVKKNVVNHRNRLSAK
jgi:predicted kinase